MAKTGRKVSVFKYRISAKGMPTAEQEIRNVKFGAVHFNRQDVV